MNEHGKLLDKWYACSDKCLDELAGEIESQISPSDVSAGEWDQVPPIHSLTKRAILNPNSKRLDPRLIREIEDGRQLYVCFHENSTSFVAFHVIKSGEEDKLRAPDNAM
jgi:hypothetical protein